MRIAYLTTDEVNKDLALRLAAQWEVTICPLEPRDAPPDGQFDAVLYDSDHWPADQLAKALSGASAGSDRRPVALHGYGLEQQPARDLRRSGILLFHRLEPRTLLELQRAVTRARALQEQEDNLDLCGPGATALTRAAQAGAEAPPSDPPCNHPPSCQPGYTIKLDPPLPSLPPAEDGRAPGPLAGSTGFASNRRRKMYRNRCLRCQSEPEGMDYNFARVQSLGLECRIAQEEKTFIATGVSRRGCAATLGWSCLLGSPWASWRPEGSSRWPYGSGFTPTRSGAGTFPQWPCCSSCLWDCLSSRVWRFGLSGGTFAG
jgi:hypothetical protein